MAARASTTAFLVCLLLFTVLLSSARALCRFEDCVVTNICKVKSIGQSTMIGPVCCKLLEPLSPREAVECICKGNPGTNIEDVYGLLGSSCSRAVPRPFFHCHAFGPLIDRNVLTLSN